MASDVHRGASPPLLTAADPAPVTVTNPDGRSPFLFIGDHAGNVIPSRLGTFGLEAPDLEGHIAWDIGIGAVGSLLADAMDATFVRQAYSRLVVDCNRRPEAEDAIPAISDGTIIPGNAHLHQSERDARVREVHEPYQRAIAAELARRSGDDRTTVLIALHSFTPALADGRSRPWHIGVLHDQGDIRFSEKLLRELRQNAALIVGDNEPYRMDAIDYTVPRHCYGTQIPYAELEIRQDLISSEDDQRYWAMFLQGCLAHAWARLSNEHPAS